MDNPGESVKSVRLKINEAAMAMNCSNASVYNRIKKYGWQHEKDIEGTAWVSIPQAYLDSLSKSTDNLRQINRGPEDKPLTTESEALSLDSPMLDKVITILEKAYEERLKDKQDLLQAKEDLLKSQETTIKALNHQLEAVQTQLVLYRDRVKGEKETPPKGWWQWWK